MPTQLFITNTANANLGQRLRELISTSREMRALVGFFYRKARFHWVFAMKTG